MQKIQLILMVLKLVWPKVSDDLSELAEKTDTKYDDWAVSLVDWLLGRVDPADVENTQAMVGCLLGLLAEIAPDLASDPEKLVAMMGQPNVAAS